jgi:hypothetical protein
VSYAEHFLLQLCGFVSVGNVFLLYCLFRALTMYLHKLLFVCLFVCLLLEHGFPSVMAASLFAIVEGSQDFSKSRHFSIL